jgi:hypothetical protein
MRRAFQDLARYPRILGIVNLRPLRGRHAYKGLLEVGPARLHAAMLGDLGVSTLRFDQDHDPVFFSLSIKPAMFPASMLGDYSTSASLTSSCFFRRTDLLGNLFPITSLLDLLFPSSLCLDHHTGHLARHVARILLHERIFDTLRNFFIVVSIYWKSASYRSVLDLSSFGKGKTGRLLS